MNEVLRRFRTARPLDLGASGDFALGVLTVHPATRQVAAGDRRKMIEPRVMQVLVTLAHADGAVVSRDQLIERCWGGRIVGDDAINSCLAKVRSLAGFAQGPSFEIETIPRVGYRLLTTRPDRNLSPTTGADFRIESSLHRTRSYRMAVTVSVVMLIVATALWLGLQHRPLHQPVQPVPIIAAVLPFTPLYADKNAKIYADEISSDVVETLGQTDLNVISPTLSFQFRGDAKARAARVLHSDIMVDGDVTRRSDSIHVAVRIEDVASRVILFSKEFVRPTVDAPDLPDQVATAIAGALGWEVSIKALRPDPRWPPRVRTGILRAVFQCPYSQDPFCAYEMGRQLVSLAPDNAIAQTILALETVNVLDRLPERERPSAAAGARAAARAAIRLDPHFGDPYIALSELSSGSAPKGPTAAAEAYLRRGLSVEPGSSAVANYLSAILYFTGRNKDALALTQDVAAHYKFEEWAYSDEIRELMGLGESAKAAEIANRSRRLWPDSKEFSLMFFEATAFGRGGADAEGLTRDPALKPFVDAPGQPATLLHLAKALRTRSSINIGAFAHDCASDSRPWLRTQLCLPGLSEFGKIEEAFRLLPAGNAEEVLFWPQTAALRSDPRFMDWIKKLGLFPYWTDTRSRPDLCASENVSLCRSIAQARNRPSRSDWGAGRRLPKG